MTCAAGRGLGAGPGAQGGGTLCSTGPAWASYRDGPGVMPGNTVLAAMTVLIRPEFAGDEALGAALWVLAAPLRIRTWRSSPLAASVATLG